MHTGRCVMEKITHTGWRSLRRFRERVFKVGMRIVLHARRATLMIAETAASHWQSLWRALEQVGLEHRVAAASRPIRFCIKSSRSLPPLRQRDCLHQLHVDRPGLAETGPLHAPEQRSDRTPARSLFLASIQDLMQPFS